MAFNLSLVFALRRHTQLWNANVQEALHNLAEAYLRLHQDAPLVDDLKHFPAKLHCSLLGDLVDESQAFLLAPQNTLAGLPSVPT
jgi:hypothetical protein